MLRFDYLHLERYYFRRYCRIPDSEVNLKTYQRQKVHTDYVIIMVKRNWEDDTLPIRYKLPMQNVCVRTCSHQYSPLSASAFISIKICNFKPRWLRTSDFGSNFCWGEIIRHIHNSEASWASIAQEFRLTHLQVQMGEFPLEARFSKISGRMSFIKLIMQYMRQTEWIAFADKSGSANRFAQLVCGYLKSNNSFQSSFLFNYTLHSGSAVNTRLIVDEQKNEAIFNLY